MKDTKLTMTAQFGSFFALYFGLCFASPLLIAITNRDDITFGLMNLTIVLMALVLALSAVSYLISSKTRFFKGIATLALTFAFVFMFQGNIIHDLFNYGSFNGQAVNWRIYGWKFWLEWVGFLAAFPLFFVLLSRLSVLPAWLTLVPVLSSVLLIAPALMALDNNDLDRRSDEDFSSEVFEFSSNVNLIHLIPDGLQGDIVREVLQDKPDLAARLEGFVLYQDHLGMYQGTAPSVATMFTGRPFDLKAGKDFGRLREDMEQYSYPAYLSENGFRLDYVTITSHFCVENADSCVVRPFNDMKPRGYFRYANDSTGYISRLLVDLALFRNLPMFLKEKIYNDGAWFFADSTLDGSSPWLDPALREWMDKMKVVDQKPRFKSYHYIGTHIPPLWDSSCTYAKGLGRQRDQYYDQTVCVLGGIADFSDRLREVGIFDQSALIVSGDHGIYVDPDDLVGTSANGSLRPRLLGAARPALLVKPMGNKDPLKSNYLPTSLIDIAPTALDLVGLERDYTGRSVMTLGQTGDRERVFHRYPYDEFWTGEPISYETWSVNGRVSDLDNWVLEEIYYPQNAPSSYLSINHETAAKTSRGLSLSHQNPDTEMSWIGGSEFSILVGIEQLTGSPKISLTIRPPPSMKQETQTFTIYVNNQRLDESIVIPESNDWHRIDVAVPKHVLRLGNNMITLNFSETVALGEHGKWHTAGELKDFQLIQ